MDKNKVTIFRNDNPHNANGWRKQEVDVQNGGGLTEGYNPLTDLVESVPSRRLMEAVTSTPDGANILRDGIRYIAFNTFNSVPTTWDRLTRNSPTTRPEEQYLRDGAFGIVPEAPSGTPAPRVKRDFEGATKVDNKLYRMIYEITGDDIKFDRIGMIQQTAELMGRAGALTKEARFYSVVTDTSKYTRNSTTGDNDIGANTQTLTFSASAFNTAWSIISTSRDRKSGTPLMLQPDTLITTPRNYAAAKQLLMSGTLNRATNTAATETFGTGTDNPFFGLVRQIIFHPMFGQNHEWLLMDSSGYGVVHQELEAPQVYQKTMVANNDQWFSLDVIEYMIRLYFGLDIVDDRHLFYSDSTTAATVS